MLRDHNSNILIKKNIQEYKVDLSLKLLILLIIYDGSPSTQTEL